VPVSPEAAGPLYTEEARLQATGLYGMAPLNNVVVPQSFLSARVNDSFEALRLQVLEKAGYDFARRCITQTPADRRAARKLALCRARHCAIAIWSARVSPLPSDHARGR
jgi:hypothetical protein